MAVLTIISQWRKKSLHRLIFQASLYSRGRRGHDCMVFGFTTSYAISTITTKVESSIPLLCTHTPKSSNQNALFIGYDILIGSFYDGKTLTFV